MNHASEAPAPPYLTGLRLLRTGDAAAAAALFRVVLRDDPSHDGAHRNLIRALIATRAFADVIDEANRHPPDTAEAWYHLGCAQADLDRADDAFHAFSRATALDPRHAAARLNLGNVFMDRDDPAQAEALCRRAIALDPGLVEAHVSLGFVLTFQGRLPAAIAVLERAIRLAPDSGPAHWNLATACLLAGDFRRGFAEYEWRKKHDRFRRDFVDPPGPVWDGADPSGRTILVHAEQGFGDTIQLARYLPAIAGLGALPVLACEEPLIALLHSIRDVRVVSKAEPLPPYDAWIDQMSLPRVFGTVPDTVPAPGGYLPVPSVPRRPGAIGLAWRGNPLHSNDRRRTPPAEVFAPLLSRTGRRFVNLVPDAELPGTEPPPEPLTDYAATARVVAALDLTIAVDTSVAHLAGAMGKSAWAMLPFAPDWRWMRGRSDTPWYRSLRLFRQPAPGDWSSVVDAMAIALAG